MSLIEDCRTFIETHGRQAHYRITLEERLAGQIEELGRAVHVLCSERIAQLESEAETAK